MDFSHESQAAIAPAILYLDEIDPAHVLFEVDMERECRFMMRVQGVDVMPVKK